MYRSIYALGYLATSIQISVLFWALGGLLWRIFVEISIGNFFFMLEMNMSGEFKSLEDINYLSELKSPI